MAAWSADMSLPIIDFGAFENGSVAERQAIADKIGSAARNIGFFILDNHRLDDALRRTGFDMAAGFFDLPQAEKNRIHIARSACHRGWFDEGGEVLDRATQPQGDKKQGLKIGRDLPPDHARVRAGLPLHGANQWPEEHAGLVGFQTTMRALYAACETLSRQLMQAFALSLDLPAGHFDRWLSEPMATLAPLRYPPMHDTQTLSAGAHSDFGCLTLLLQNDQAGLEVQTQGGWLGVPCLPSQIVVNIGDMMQRWTNGAYASTVHRVVNRSGKTRHSIAYFFDPDPDADLTPLPGCGGETAPPLTALQHLLNKIDDSFDYRNI